MSKPIIETNVDSYRLTVGGESSEFVPFGSPLEVELGGGTWLCFVDLPDGEDESGETESVLANWLYKVEPVADDQIEFVDSDDEDGGEDGGEEDDDEVEELHPVTD